MRILPITVALVAFALPAFAGTKYQTNIVPTPGDCFGGLGVCLNNYAGCNDPFGNSDCQASGVSPKSSVRLDGKRQLKFSLKEVRDAAGALVTTGPEGAADNYLLDIELRICVPDAGDLPYCSGPNVPSSHVIVKVVLNGGNGRGRVDLRPVLSAPPLSYPQATSVRVRSVSFLTPHIGCPGTNSAVDISSRLLVGNTCNDGAGVLGMDGVVVE